MKTTENNKLIAEFMGYEEQDMSFRIPKQILKIEQENDCPNSQDLDCWDVPLKSLQYHTSWDWLMPVVTKCLDIYHIEQMNDDLNFKFYDSIGDIKKTYKAVVEFIVLGI